MQRIPNYLYIDRDDGGPVNVYRLAGPDVEFRVLNADGSALANGSPWRPLSDDEVRLHHTLGTVVSHWMDSRLTQQQLQKAA
jgi:hypothetical protein